MNLKLAKAAKKNLSNGNLVDVHRFLDELIGVYKWKELIERDERENRGGKKEV